MPVYWLLTRRILQVGFPFSIDETFVPIGTSIPDRGQIPGLSLEHVDTHVAVFPRIPGSSSVYRWGTLAYCERSTREGFGGYELTGQERLYYHRPLPGGVGLFSVVSDGFSTYGPRQESHRRLKTAARDYIETSGSSSEAWSEWMDAAEAEPKTTAYVVGLVFRIGAEAGSWLLSHPTVVARNEGLASCVEDWIADIAPRED